MEGDFVTYDISVKLKAKGYPQKSFGKYSMVVGFVWFTKLIIKLANESDKDDV